MDTKHWAYSALMQTSGLVEGQSGERGQVFSIKYTIGVRVESLGDLSSIMAVHHACMPNTVSREKFFTKMSNKYLKFTVRLIS